MGGRGLGTALGQLASAALCLWVENPELRAPTARPPGRSGQVGGHWLEEGLPGSLWMGKWATMSTPPRVPTGNKHSLQAAPQGSWRPGTRPFPGYLARARWTWCSLRVARRTTGPSGGLARQVLRVRVTVLVSAQGRGSACALGLPGERGWELWPEALCVDVSYAPAKLPWATLLGVIP